MTWRFFPRSLAAQLSVLLLAAVLLAQAITAYIFAESRRSAIDAAAREQVLGRTAALARLLEETSPADRDRILAASSSTRLRYSVDVEPVVPPAEQMPIEPDMREKLNELFGPDREIVAKFSSEAPSADLPDHMGQGHGDDDHGGGRMHGRFGRPTIAMAVRLKDGLWLNSETLLPRPVLWAWPTMVSTFLTALGVVGAVALSVRRITKPLRQLALASDRLGRGETVPDLPEGGPRELAAANRAFNAMQARVRRFVADRTRMVAAISHDLRTPLTALRLRAEFVDDDDIRDRIIDSVDEMVRMTEATLAFAREDAAQEETRTTDLAALVEAVADDFADIGNDIEVSAPGRLDHPVRPVSLRRALRNLVENAIRYGDRARIRLERDDREIRILVDDDGPGIPADRLEDVFAPFTRLESSRNAETGGVGLGLSTARSIVRAHGGELILANRPGGGLTAAIHLPSAVA